MKIAYFSPVNPIKSGISDFSEELLIYMQNIPELEIDLFTQETELSNPHISDIYTVHAIYEIENDELREKYDLLVYQMGNYAPAHAEIAEMSLKYPGILELHDFALHHMLGGDIHTSGDFGRYTETLKYCHGKKGEKLAKDHILGKDKVPWERVGMEFPVNKHLIDASLAVIVHSDFVFNLVKGIQPLKPIKKIPLFSPEISESFDSHMLDCRKKLEISADDFIIGSFGFATINKRYIPVLKALARLKANNFKFRYFIVGEVQDRNILAQIKELQLENDIFITGFVGLDEFNDYLGACDVCVQLRHPTMGESSASLHRALGLGKVVLVTDTGSFAEYPDDFVPKISVGENETRDIFLALRNLVSYPHKLAKKKKSAVGYAKNQLSLPVVCNQYLDFYKNLPQISKNSNSYSDELADKLFGTDISDRGYLRYIAERMEIFLPCGKNHSQKTR